MKRTVKQRVDEYVNKHPETYNNLLVIDMNEIRELGNMVDVISTAFAYGYMKGVKTKKGGVKMTVYKAALLKLLDRLSDKSIKRLYQLAQYLYVYKE